MTEEKAVILCLNERKTEDCFGRNCVDCDRDVLVSNETFNHARQEFDEKNIEILCESCFVKRDGDFDIQDPNLETLQELRKHIPDFNQEHLNYVHNHIDRKVKEYRKAKKDGDKKQ